MKNEKTIEKNNENSESDNKLKKNKIINKKDIIIMSIITIIYAIVSFINLGSFTNPQTYWKSTRKDNEVILELEHESKIEYIRYYVGNINGRYEVSFSKDGNLFIGKKILNPESVFHWYDLKLKEENEYKYIKIQAKDAEIYLGEIGVFDENKNLLKITSKSISGNVLIDEQNTIPEEITYLNSSYFDEIYFARTAYEHLHGLPAYEWTHPPLGKLIMAVPIAIFGMTPFAYRLLGNIAGILMLPVIYILAKMLFKKTKYSATAAIIMALDGMHFVQTRIGTVDSYLVLFTLLEYLFMYKYVVSKDQPIGKRLWALFWSGLFMGISISIKWLGVFSAIGLAIIFFISFIKEIIEKRKLSKQNIIIILCCVIFFIIIPALIYTLSYIPFYIVESPYVSNVSRIKDVSSFIELQEEMYNYHHNLKATHDYSSEWYTWPITQKSVFYWLGKTSDGNYSKIALLGNPIIFWVSIPCMIFVLFRGLVKHKTEDWFIIIAIISMFMPYIGITRIMYLYHYFPILPFAMLSIVAFFKFICDKINNNIPIYIFLLTALVVFVMFYPIYSGLPVKNEYLESLKWLKTWIW